MRSTLAAEVSLPALLLLPLPAGSPGSLQGLLHYTGQGDPLLPHTGQDLYFQAPFADILSSVSPLGVPQEVCSRVNRPGETLSLAIVAGTGARAGKVEEGKALVE